MSITVKAIHCTSWHYLFRQPCPYYYYYLRFIVVDDLLGFKNMQRTLLKYIVVYTTLKMAVLQSTICICMGMLCMKYFCFINCFFYFFSLTNISFCMFNYLLIMFYYLFIFLSIYLSINQSVSLAINLSVYPSIFKLFCIHLVGWAIFCFKIYFSECSTFPALCF